MSIIRISRPKSFSTQLARKRESLDVSFNVVLQIPNTLGSLTTKSTFVQSIRALLYMLIDCIFHFTDILRLPRFDVVHGFLGVLGVYVATQRLLCGEPPWLGAVRALEPGKMVECSPALVCCHVSLVGGEVLLPVVNSLALVAPLPLRPVGPQPLQPAVVAAAAVAVLLMVVEPEAGVEHIPTVAALGLHKPQTMFGHFLVQRWIENCWFHSQVHAEARSLLPFPPMHHQSPLESSNTLRIVVPKSSILMFQLLCALRNILFLGYFPSF